jgi:hypothetical protein
LSDLFDIGINHISNHALNELCGKGLKPTGAYQMLGKITRMATKNYGAYDTDPEIALYADVLPNPGSVSHKSEADLARGIATLTAIGGTKEREMARRHRSYTTSSGTNLS